VIRIGEFAYVRYHKRYPATFCLPCHEKRSEQWTRNREKTSDFSAVLAALEHEPKFEEELQDLVDPPIRGLIRKLIRRGYPIDIVQVKAAKQATGTVLYYRTDLPALIKKKLLELVGRRAVTRYSEIFESEFDPPK
jgi:hypothetical protein